MNRADKLADALRAMVVRLDDHIEQDHNGRDGDGANVDDLDAVRDARAILAEHDKRATVTDYIAESESYARENGVDPPSMLAIAEQIHDDDALLAELGIPTDAPTIGIILAVHASQPFGCHHPALAFADYCEARKATARDDAERLHWHRLQGNARKAATM